MGSDMRTAFLIVLKKLEKGTPNVKNFHWCGKLPLAHVGQTKRKDIRLRNTESFDVGSQLRTRVTFEWSPKSKHHKLKNGRFGLAV